jgi:hypothetical protein
MRDEDNMEDEEMVDDDEQSIRYLLLSKRVGDLVAVTNCSTDRGQSSSSSQPEYMLVLLVEAPSRQIGRHGPPVHVNYSGASTQQVDRVVFKGVVVGVPPEGGEEGLLISKAGTDIHWFDDTVVLDIFVKASVSKKDHSCGESRRGLSRNSKKAGGSTGKDHVFIELEEHMDLLDKAEMYAELNP